MTHTNICLIFVILVLFSMGALAQTQPAIGTPAFASFGGGPFDVVNLGNLNVHFAIPVLHKAGRGMPFNYDLSYDSSVWYPVASNGNQSWQHVDKWGWLGTELYQAYI